MSPEPTPPKNDTGEIERDFAKSARPIPRAGRVQPQQRRRELATGGGGSLFLNRLARSARASRQESLAMLRLRARAATTAERRSDDGAAHDTSHDATVELATVPAGARPGSRFTHRAPWQPGRRDVLVPEKQEGPRPDTGLRGIVCTGGAPRRGPLALLVVCLLRPVAPPIVVVASRPRCDASLRLLLDWMDYRPTVVMLCLNLKIFIELINYHPNSQLFSPDRTATPITYSVPFF